MFPDADPYPPIAIPHEAAGARRATSRPLSGLLRGALRQLPDVVSPPACLACSAATAEPDRFCAPCWRKVRFIERPYCDRVCLSFDKDLGGPLFAPRSISHP